MAKSSATSRRYKSPPLNEDAETLEVIGNLGEVQCPPEEMARVRGNTLAQMTKFLAKPRVRSAYEAGKARGLLRLRQAQFKMAATSVPMATLLGKTYLGQNERRESDDSTPSEEIGAAERVRAKLAAIAAEELP